MVGTKARMCPKCNELVLGSKFPGHMSGHSRSEKAKYVYVDGDTKHPYEKKACETCGLVSLIQKRRRYCSRRCSKMGDLNPSQQKNSNHGLTPSEYAGFHTRVRKVRGKAMKCVNGCEDRVLYQWANLTGNYADVSDYQEMCVPCHDKFDRARFSQ